MSVFVREGGVEQYIKKAPITSILIAANLIMLFVVIIYGGFETYTLLRLGALWAPLVKDGETWRLVTSMFLHGSVIHFIGNAIIGLYVLSSSLERTIGSKKFILIYFLSGLGAGLLVTYTTNALTIGASGAIFGALGSLLYIGIYRKDLMSRQDFQSIKGLVIANIFFTFLIPNISIAGHVGGIATGFLLSFIFIKRKTYEETTYAYDSYDAYDNSHENPWRDN
jgi:rhomboid protease GluP